jgi:hypothetical protein
MFKIQGEGTAGQGRLGSSDARFTVVEDGGGTHHRGLRDQSVGAKLPYTDNASVSAVASWKRKGAEKESDQSVSCRTRIARATSVPGQWLER